MKGSNPKPRKPRCAAPMTVRFTFGSDPDALHQAMRLVLSFPARTDATRAALTTDQTMKDNDHE